jgi:hypothetical protein
MGILMMCSHIFLVETSMSRMQYTCNCWRTSSHLCCNHRDDSQKCLIWIFRKLIYFYKFQEANNDDDDDDAAAVEGANREANHVECAQCTEMTAVMTAATTRIVQVCDDIFFVSFIKIIVGTCKSSSTDVTRFRFWIAFFVFSFMNILSSRWYAYI